MIGWVTRPMLPHLSGFPRLHVNRPIIKMSQIRINSKHFIFITVIIVDRKCNSPRPGQSSPTQTKIREHIKISLRTNSIKFLLVITMLYKTKNGRYQVLNTVPSALKVTLYRTYGNNRTWRFSSIIVVNKLHAHHKTHLHTMKVITILIPGFSMVSARHGWDHGWPFGEDTWRKTPAFLESRSAKASSTKK